MDNTITINFATYKKLKKAYQEALKNNETIFIFEGHELLINYAKYLLQYLDMQLGVKNDI